MRADITRRLITDHGFQFVSLESDWPDTYRLNRYHHTADTCTQRRVHYNGIMV
jgi:erythromycin esterase-like protein